MRIHGAILRKEGNCRSDSTKQYADDLCCCAKHAAHLDKSPDCTYGYPQRALFSALLYTGAALFCPLVAMLGALVCFLCEQEAVIIYIF